MNWSWFSVISEELPWVCWVNGSKEVTFPLSPSFQISSPTSLSCIYAHGFPSLGPTHPYFEESFESSRMRPLKGLPNLSLVSASLRNQYFPWAQVLSQAVTQKFEVWEVWQGSGLHTLPSESPRYCSVLTDHSSGKNGERKGTPSSVGHSMCLGRQLGGRWKAEGGRLCSKWLLRIFQDITGHPSQSIRTGTLD